MDADPTAIQPVTYPPHLLNYRLIYPELPQVMIHVTTVRSIALQSKVPEHLYVTYIL
jgi:hypothetical protein